MRSIALLYKGSNSQSQFPHSLSARIIAEINSSPSAFPSSHLSAGRESSSHPDAANFSIISFDSSMIKLFYTKFYKACRERALQNLLAANS